MNCNDCGAPLDEVTIRASGQVLCPGCGKTILWQIAQNEPQSQSLQADHERFEYQEPLGQGASGLVYKAFDKELQRFVAIKIPRDELLQKNSASFLSEARAASRLRHPNIVTIHDVIQLQSSIHIVSEYVDGISLKLWVDQRKPGIEESCKVVAKICRAVAYAHEHGVIHRDIKPANVVMDKSDEPHLLDFGLSCSRQIADQSAKSSGRPLGTPAFMSPEQVEGDMNNIAQPTDVYSVGVILYQMLTQHLPFSGSGDQLYSKILHQPPTPPRELNLNVSASLQAICLKAMAKQPQERYATAKCMADDLENYLEGKVVSAYGKWEVRTIKHFARRRFVAGLAASSAAGLGAMSWWNFSQTPKETLRNLKNAVLDVEAPTGKVYFQRLSEIDGQLDAERIEIESGKPFQILPGFYRVTYENPDELFYVYRTIPQQDKNPVVKISYGIELPHRNWNFRRGTFRLPKLVVKPSSSVQAGMVFQDGGILRPTKSMEAFKKLEIALEPFWIDSQEVSNKQFFEVFPDFDRIDGMEIGGKIANVTFEHVLAFAEVIGKQIQTVWQWLYACTNAGTTKFPWGASTESQIWPLESDEIFNNKSEPAISGLYSGVLEWADTFPPKLPTGGVAQVDDPYAIDTLRMRAVVGGPLEFKKKELRLEKSNNPMWFAFEESTKYFPNVGFRCARTLKQKGSPK